MFEERKDETPAELNNLFTVGMMRVIPKAERRQVRPGDFVQFCIAQVPYHPPLDFNILMCADNQSVPCRLRRSSRFVKKKYPMTDVFCGRTGERNRCRDVSGIKQEVGRSDSEPVHGLSGLTVFNKSFFMSVRCTSHCSLRLQCRSGYCTIV